METVCLDSHILIWGIKEEATPGQDAMIPKAKRFLEWLDENSYNIIIPAHVIGELLMPIPPEIHAEFTNLFQDKFKIVPYDLAATSCFASMWRKRNDDGTGNLIRQQFNIGREQMKIDYEIIACAVTKNAKCIYSYDPALKAFAEGFIDVKEMPNIGTQVLIAGEGF